jgi:hypothetical protein
MNFQAELVKMGLEVFAMVWNLVVLLIGLLLVVRSENNNYTK